MNSQFSSYSSNSNNSTILNSISNAISTLTDTLNKSTSKSFSDIVKSTLPINIPTASKTTPKIHLCSQPSVIIEHISPTNRNLTYIHSLFKQLELDPNTITEYSLISHYANLVLSSAFTTDSLLNSRSSLQLTDLKTLFIRPFIPSDTIKIGRIYFHSSKSIMTKYKCVFNRYKLSYELRLFTTNSHSDIKVIDWKSNPYIPDDNECIQWSNSNDHLRIIVKMLLKQLFSSSSYSSKK